MSITDIKNIIFSGESRILELKKSTGELQDGMHSACAMLNSDGGWLIFGVTPKSQHLIGQMITDDTQREIAQSLSGLYPVVDVAVEYVDIPEKPGHQLVAMHFNGWSWGQKPYTYHGRPYYKVESTTKVMPQEMYEERLRAAKPDMFAWERQVAEGIDLSDLDERRISGAVRLGVERGRMPATAETENEVAILEKWNLLSRGNMTNGAVALFGKSLGGFTQMSLRMARFRGNDMIEFVDSQRVTGNFFDLLDAGMAFLFKHLSLSGKIVGFKKEEQLEVPAEALREALTNALCHRQFEKYNMTIGIAVFDDRVEIENPGRLPLGVTPENIKQTHASHPYNPLIATVLFKTSFLESWGSGVSRMVEACKKQGLPEPEYKEEGGYVRIVFLRPTGAVMETSGIKDETKNEVKEDFGIKDGIKDGIIKLNENQQIVLNIIRTNETLTAQVLAQKTGFGVRSVLRYLSELQSLGVIVRRGGRKSGYWEVISK